jgi:hypothetical protein
MDSNQPDYLKVTDKKVYTLCRLLDFGLSLVGVCVCSDHMKKAGTFRDVKAKQNRLLLRQASGTPPATTVPVQHGVGTRCTMGMAPARLAGTEVESSFLLEKNQHQPSSSSNIQNRDCDRWVKVRPYATVVFAMCGILTVKGACATCVNHLSLKDLRLTLSFASKLCSWRDTTLK